jgi:hypothetical protein
MRRPALTALRAVWLTLPVTAGPGLDDALQGASGAVRWVAGVGLWATWAVALLALLVPRVASLTVLRIAVPAALAATIAAAVAGGVEAVDLLGVGAASVAVVLTLWPTVGDAMVDGSSYGPERRVPLRVPPSLAFGPAPLAVAIAVGGAVTGPLLLAAGQWVAGAIATVVGVALAAGAVRSLHGLARRFLVLVPGGVVVHDPMTLVDPVLLPKAALAAVGPAPADTDATDLTVGAGGLVLELRLLERLDVVLRRPGRGPDELTSTAAVLVDPTRPATFLTEARARHLPVPAP